MKQATLAQANAVYFASLNPADPKPKGKGKTAKQEPAPTEQSQPEENQADPDGLAAKE